MFAGLHNTIREGVTDAENLIYLHVDGGDARSPGSKNTDRVNQGCDGVGSRKEKEAALSMRRLRRSVFERAAVAQRTHPSSLRREIARRPHTLRKGGIFSG